MRDVNGWLMALSFLLGLLLTFAMMIRRVTREVPVTPAGAPAPLHRAPDKAPDKAAAKPARAGAEVGRVGPGEKKIHAKVAKTEVAVAEVTGEVLEKEPYGAGSVRVSARTAPPAGYTIKGDKDTGRFFTVDSPEYAAIEAEVWFADEQSAARAGFLRWDARGDQKAGPTAAAAVITEQHIPADSSMVIVESGSAEADSALRIVSGTEDQTPPRS